MPPSSQIAPPRGMMPPFLAGEMSMADNAVPRFWRGRGVWRVEVRSRGKYRRKEGDPRFIDKYQGFKLYHIDMAHRLCSIVNAEIDAGTYHPGHFVRDRTLEIERAWNTYQVDSPCGNARLKDRDRIFQTYILPHFLGKTMDQIEEHHFSDWSAHLPDTLAPGTRHLINITFRAFLTWHPITRQKRFRYASVRVPKKPIPWLTVEAQERVLAALSERHRPIFNFLMSFGCRVSEACNLKWTDLDWEKRTITLRDRKAGDFVTLAMPEGMEGLVGSRTVGNMPERESVRLPDAKTFPEHQAPTNLTFVFSTALGRPYPRRVLGNIWAEALKKAGISHIPLKNGTRSSLAAQQTEKGTGTPVIARTLGNTEAIVRKNYARVGVGATAEIINLRKVSG